MLSSYNEPRALSRPALELEPPPRHPRSRSAASPGVVLAIVSVAAFLASLDLFIVNVAFPSIGHDFRGASLSNLSWILNAYAIVYAALLVPAGRLADRFGRRPGFLLGLGLFTLASVGCAVSPSLWPLVGFRALQAGGAAILTPASLGLLLSATPAERRSGAVKIWAAVGTLAAAAGPIAGGVLVQASWRWVFLVNLPFGITGLILGARLLPNSRDHAVRRLPDLLGSAVITGSVGALALGVVQGPNWGWLAPQTVATFALSAASLTVFAYRSGHHPAPVIEPALLRVRAFAWSNVTAVLFSIGFAGALLAIVLWMQDVWGYSALRAGLAIAPGPLMVPFFSLVGHRLGRRVSVGRLTAVGCLVFAAGTLLIGESVGPQPDYLTAILPGWLLSGTGVGLALPTLLSAATVDLPAARTATGSAVLNMSRQIGTVLGISILVAILGAPAGYVASHGVFQDAWWVTGATLVLAAAASSRMTPRSRGTTHVETLGATAAG